MPPKRKAKEIAKANMSPTKKKRSKDSIVYPGNCQPIFLDSEKSEKIKRLKALHKVLSDYQKELNEDMSIYEPLALHLTQAGFLDAAKSSSDVQVYTVCCLGDLIRLFSPYPLFEGEDLMRVMIAICKTLRGLSRPDDPLFDTYYYLLENINAVNTLSLGALLEQEQCTQIVMAMFKHFFAVLQSTSSFKDHGDQLQRVGNLLAQVMGNFLNAAGFVDVEPLDFLFCNIVEPIKSQSREAYNVAKMLLSKMAGFFEPYVGHFFMVALSDDANAKDLRDSLSIVTSGRVYALIASLYDINADFVSCIIPQIEGRVATQDAQERAKVCKSIGQIFASPGSNLADTSPQLWDLWLKKFTDADAGVRKACIAAAKDVLVRRRELRCQLLRALKGRLVDIEEAIRTDAISCIINLAKYDSHGVSEELLQEVAERCKDKKLTVRSTAAQALASLFSHTMDPVNGIQQSDLRSLDWIPEKLFAIHTSDLDDRFVIDNIFVSSIAPYTANTELRMKMLHSVFVRASGNSIRVINVILRRRCEIRRAVRNWLRLYTTTEPMKNNCNNNRKLDYCCTEMKFIIKRIGTLTHVSTEVLNEYFRSCARNPIQFKKLEYVFGKEYSCAQVLKLKAELIKFESDQKPNQRHTGTVSKFFERAAPIIIDQEAVSVAIKIVKMTIDVTELEEFEPLTMAHVRQRGLELIDLLSFNYAPSFNHKGVMRDLIRLIKAGAENGIDESDDKEPHKILMVKTGILSFTSIQIVPDNILDELQPLLAQLSRYGPPKVAKLAVRCLTAVSRTVDGTFESPTFDEIIKHCAESIDYTDLSNTELTTALVATNALCVPEHMKKYLAPVLELVKKAINKIIKNDMQHSHSPEDLILVNKWRLPPECRAKIAAIKLAARYFEASGNHLAAERIRANHSNNTPESSQGFATNPEYDATLTMFLNLMNQLVAGKFQLPNMLDSDRDALRLAAGVGLLRMGVCHSIDRMMSTQLKRNLASLIFHQNSRVRDRFSNRLCKRLSLAHYGSIVSLLIDYAAFFVFAPLVNDGSDEDQTDDEMRRSCSFIKDTQTRFEQIIERKKAMLRSAAADRAKEKTQDLLRATHMPEYAIPYAVHMLAWHKQLRSHEDVDTLDKLKRCLWLLLECFVTKRHPLPTASSAANQQATHWQNPNKIQERATFIYRLLDMTKHYQDTSNENETHSKKIWALCDIGMNLISARAHNFIIPDNANKGGVKLLRRYYHMAPQWMNNPNSIVYAPTQLFEAVTVNKRKHLQDTTNNRRDAPQTSIGSKLARDTILDSPIDAAITQSSTREKKTRRTAKFLAVSTPIVERADDDNEDSGESSRRGANRTRTPQTVYIEPSRKVPKRVLATQESVVLSPVRRSIRSHPTVTTSPSKSKKMLKRPRENSESDIQIDEPDDIASSSHSITENTVDSMTQTSQLKEETISPKKSPRSRRSSTKSTQVSPRRTPKTVDATSQVTEADSRSSPLSKSRSKNASTQKDELLSTRLKDVRNIKDIRKKRGRKSKETIVVKSEVKAESTDEEIATDQSSPAKEKNEPPPPKRGRGQQKNKDTVAKKVVKESTTSSATTNTVETSQKLTRRKIKELKKGTPAVKTRPSRSCTKK